MQFRSEYKAERSEFLLDPERPVVMLGSCFSENIAGRMRACLWQAENPLGTLYNPLSIARTLAVTLGIDCDSVAEFSDTLFVSNGVNHSWLFDSKLSSTNSQECMARFEEKRVALDSLLKLAEVMFVTLGTAYCYYLAEKQDYPVANCHKMPADIFTRRRLSIDEIVDCWIDIIGKLKVRYPQLRIVFTVSPVRHLKDGFHGNQLSKATLQLAVDRICAATECCSYFPAYEILQDDLRDYRFYASDLVHPSEQGVEYIWEKFRETYIDAAGEAKLKAGEKECKRRAHRPIIEK
jgi:hypothetical protein